MKAAKDMDISTPSKRLKLPARRNPYWTKLAGKRGGVSLGYRRGEVGPGAWIGKVVIGGSRIEQRIGTADDDDAGLGSLPYRAAITAALAWSQQQHAAVEASKKTGRTKAPTVATAINQYIAARLKRSARNGADAEKRLKRHALADEKFASVPLAKLRSSDIHDWRDRLPVVAAENHSQEGEGAPSKISASTLNRLLNDVRAALNAAVERHRRELPGAVPLEIKIGTRAVPASANARRQILSDAQVASAVKAAFDVDEDFGYLVLLAVATGARHSQLRRIAVGDVQVDMGRVMVPAAGKGRHVGEKPPIAVPLTDDVLGRLAPILAGRGADEPLLTRWHHVQVSTLKWQRQGRRAWGIAAETARPWASTVERAELPPDTVFYALRHSSVVRGLRAGLPVRLVAASHDTSTQMLEKHYAKFIMDAAVDLSRRAAFSLA